MKYPKKLFILILTISCFLLSTANAEDNSSKLTHKLTMSIAYSVCIDPKKPICYAFKEADKVKCSHCQEWGSNFLGSDKAIALAFPESKYSYDSGLGFPRANYMLQDAAKKLYDVEFPTTKHGLPVTVKAIYINPEIYGWIEVDKDSKKVGALAIWPNIGGIVVQSENEKGMLQDTVLYPSDKKRGKLNILNAEKLKTEGVPKFIIPKVIIGSKVSGSIELER